MTMPMLVPEEQRRFAVEVVRRLRGAGFDAYWAGGCVRDQLLGRTPKDYDVATSATPEQVRELFGHRRTLAIGAAFGVAAVIGPKGSGTVEVTTFRRDAAYSDGRHPDSVTFSSAQEDAARRDFTINGLFYDPIERRVIDFVGGQEDLAAKRIRAIGYARDRFAEDKLRMLRAVRFTAAFAFTLDTDTWAAIAEMAAGNPRRQPRADRHGNAANALRRQPGDGRSVAVGNGAGRGSAARNRAPRRFPVATLRRHARIDLTAGTRVRLSAGPGRRALSLGGRGGSGRGLPPLAALEQGNGARLLARRKPQCLGRRSEPCAGRRFSRC